MSYGSKTISGKIAAAREIASRAHNLSPAVAAALAEQLRPVVDVAAGEELPDLVQLQEMIGRTIEEWAAKMAALHDRHHHSRALEQHQAARVRQAANALRDHLREVRFVFDRHFGCRQGVANFEGRHDLLRLPMHSLERVCSGLLRVLEDENFGWSASPYLDIVLEVRERFAALLESYRDEVEAGRELRGRRAHAAAERERGIAECELHIGRLTYMYRQLCQSAGYASVVRGMRRRHDGRRRPAKKAAAVPAAPVSLAPPSPGRLVRLPVASPGAPDKRRWRRRRRSASR